MKHQFILKKSSASVFWEILNLALGNVKSVLEDSFVSVQENDKLLSFKSL